jgi:inorganic triphosphatase YgiF
MEIEAKFIVPNSGLFERLQAAEQIGEYSLKEPVTQTLTDHYLDTADGLILRGGYACRSRHNHTRGTWVGAVKGLGAAQGAVHQREEFEVPIAPESTPDRWPESPARALALRLSQARPLVERAAIHQTRHVRSVVVAGRRAAELSLDRVTFHAGEKRADSMELEIELKEAGALDDLHALIGALSEYGLQPEPRSKFERALALWPPP